MYRKVAVITGASSGVGLAITRMLASKGYSLALIARNEKELDKIAADINKSFQINVQLYACDITQGKDLYDTVNKIKKDFVKVDILVNNAGGSNSTASDDVFDTAFNKDIELNLRGTHLCCKFISKIMKNGGAIVNMSSINGEVVLFPLYKENSLKIGYAAAKAGVIQLTKAYAITLARRRIRVNAVAPGAIYPTGMTGDWSKEKQKVVAQGIPLQRLGKPEDVAHAVYFLVSDSSTFITGHTLDVNGGRYMR